MSAEPVAEHLCVNGGRCVDKIDGHARETEQANSFCGACLSRAAERVEQLPEQYVRLHHMIGDRHAGVDVQIRRTKPSSTILLNVHVDTLLGAILEASTTAAEVLADRMGMNNPTHSDPARRVQACSRIIAPNLPMLASIKGVGGRDDDDPTIDIMEWLESGTLFIPGTTSGVALVQQLDCLSSLAHFSLGMTRARIHRSTPCSRCRAKAVGRWAGDEWWSCDSCGARFQEDDIRRQDKILLYMYQNKLLKVGE